MFQLQLTNKCWKYKLYHKSYQLWFTDLGDVNKKHNNYLTYLKMKRDLYRFAKARRHNERIYLWEAEWHKKHNEEYYKQKTTTIG